MMKPGRIRNDVARAFLALVFIAFSLTTGVAHAVSTGMLFPTSCKTGGGSGPSWHNPANAEASDGAYATASNDDSTTEQLICTGYQFNIPAGATINGITVTIVRRSSRGEDDPARDADLNLLQAGATVGTNEAATGTNYPTTGAQAATYGSSSDLWGATWAPSDINNSQFGVAFRSRLRDDDDTVSVDYIGIAVDYTPDTTPPTVTSITTADVNPTSAASVDWTVTFSEAVTGVTAADFTLVPTSLGGTPAITAVSGSGATWTVTATTGSGAGTLGLNMTSAAGVADLAGNALTGVPVTGGVYTIDPTAPSQCYGDDFNRANGNPGSDWVVGNEGGSFGDPVIYNQRLRLTNNSASASTYATLAREFPGAGNKIVVEFMQYAYGGNGADGMGVVLSDASSPLSAGAFGGSMGYAPKQESLGGDTTHEGFAGGWLGVALDEYGNFSDNTEGRQGGSAPGLTPESVAIRGSGSGYTGYDYLTGTGTLAPGIDQSGSTAGPGYLYRITVDHSDSVHAWTSVERDVTGTGSNFTYLIPPFDALTEPGQVAVPASWRLSFTGATGGQTNIHEIDALQVCSITQRPLTLDHIQLEYSGTTCGAATVTVKACADASCTALYPGSVTVDFSRSPTHDTSWSSDPVTFSGGETQVTLNDSNTGTVTIGATGTSPTPANPTVYLADGAVTSSPAIAFASACFAAVESGTNPATPIYTKLVGTSFTLRILATQSGQLDDDYDTGGRHPDPTVAVTLVDPTASSGNCNDTNAGLVTSQNIDMNNGIGTVTFNSSIAAKDVKVRMYANGTTTPTCSLDNFAIRPTNFALSTTPDLTNTANSYAAGSNFTINANPGVTSNYVGTPALSMTHLSAFPASSNIPLSGSFPAATGGVSSGTFKYDDVGTLTFNTDAVQDAQFTAVDQVTGVVNGVDHGTSPDCIAGSTSDTLNNSRYGCVIGSSPMGPIGRFRPDHYDVTSTLTPACTNFTYMSQPALGVSLSLQAMGADGVQLPSYDSTSGYTPLAAFTVTGDDGGTAVSLDGRLTPSLPAFNWTGGLYTVSAPTTSFNRNAAPDGSYEHFALKTTVTDSDGVAIRNADSSSASGGSTVSSKKSNTTAIRFGRLKLSNAYGSELLDLPITMETQYWQNGVGFVTNTDDSCAAFTTDSVVLKSPVPAGSIAGSTVSGSTPVQFVGGQASVVLKKPTSYSSKGSVPLCIDLDGNATPNDPTCQASVHADLPWLQGNWGGSAYDYDPSVLGTFGIYKNGPVIYLREVY